jgi:hypothetical protein
MEHSEIIAWAIEGTTSPIRLRRIAAVGELAGEVGEVPRQASAARQSRTDQAGSAQPSYSAHIAIWYSIVTQFAPWTTKLPVLPAVSAVQKATDALHMPSTIATSFQGNAQAFQSALANTPILIAAAIVAVYLILGMLYESTIHPVTILSTLPSAGLGALLALGSFGLGLDVIGLIGIILLIGIAEERHHADRFRAGGRTQRGLDRRAIGV